MSQVPKYEIEPYRSTKRTVALMNKAALGRRGAGSLKLRLTVENIIRYVRPRDRLSQLAAIYNWFNERFVYVNDPTLNEQVKDPERLLEEIEEYGLAIGDCDCAATFLRAAAMTLGIPAEFVRVGFKSGSASLGDSGLTHVLTRARDQHGRGIVIDPVADRQTPQMIRRVRVMRKGVE